MIFFVTLGHRSLQMSFETQEVRRNENGKFDVTLIFNNSKNDESVEASMSVEEAISLGESVINAAHASRNKTKYEMKVRL